MLDNRYALLFIRGERPVRDDKYDILKHPNVRFTADGGTKPYLHGGTHFAIAALRCTEADRQVRQEPVPLIEIEQSQYELLSEADIEEQYKEVNEL